MESIVIIGSGMAGYGLLRELRKLDRETPVTVITADDGAAYSKPNLSNGLASNKTPESLVIQSARQIAESLNAQVLTHTRVLGINTVAQQVEIDKGSIGYGKLVLALGADTIDHGVKGSGISKIFSVNDLADYASFRAALEGKKNVAILGGGLIGCEFANDLVAAGYGVSVIHRGSHPLERLLPAQISHRLAAALSNAGVEWFYGRTAVNAEIKGDGVALTLDDGQVMDADLVLSAIGLRPRIALAEQTGTVTNRGIVVDRDLRTSEAHIYALGDCVEVEGMVLPFVQPLLQQARALASTLAGKPAQVSYPAMPVVVKTPALPVTVVPPSAEIKGGWSLEEQETHVVARFENEEGALRGFALAGQAPGLRSELIKQMPPMLL